MTVPELQILALKKLSFESIVWILEQNLDFPWRVSFYEKSSQLADNQPHIFTTDSDVSALLSDPVRLLFEGRLLSAGA